MEQTAIEWLFEQLWNSDKDKFVWHSLLEQAKEMEKQQIEKAYNQGWLQCNIEDLPERSRKRFYDSEEYYKEKFKK
jgi:DNA polymerase IIIc chi subunit